MKVPTLSPAQMLGFWMVGGGDASACVLAPPSLALKSKCCGRGATVNVACAECAQMCTVGEEFRA